MFFQQILGPKRNGTRGCTHIVVTPVLNISHQFSSLYRCAINNNGMLNLLIIYGQWIWAIASNLFLKIIFSNVFLLFD